MVSLQKIAVSGIFVLWSSFAGSISPGRPVAGAGDAGMSFAGMMKPGVWSSFQNQALLPLLDRAAFAFSFENRFGLKELTSRSVCLTIPSGHAAAGMFYSRYGSPDFRRETTGLAAGVMLGPNLSAGVETDLFIAHSAGDYRDYYLISFQGGLLFSIRKNVSAAIHIFNPIPNIIRKSALPSAISAGAGIRINSDLFAGLVAEMITGSEICLRTGFEYTAGKKFKIRGGYSSSGPSFSLGAGWSAGPALLDIAFVTHPQLGITPSLSVSFLLANRKN